MFHKLVEVKSSSYPITDLHRPLKLLDVDDPRIYGQSAREDGKVVSSTHRLPLPPGRSLILISDRG